MIMCARAHTRTDQAGELLQIRPDPQQIFKPEAFKEQLYMKVKCKRNENPENLRASIEKVSVYSIAVPKPAGFLTKADALWE